MNNCLKGAPYTQILLYIKNGTCTLGNYQDILDILEYIFSDLNYVNNAYDKLFGLCQINKKFNAFFAEFQHLVLEGEIYKGTLSTLLKQAIS